MALASRLVQKGLLMRPARGVYRLYHPLFGDFVVSAADPDRRGDMTSAASERTSVKRPHGSV